MCVSAAAYPPEPEKLGELYELGYRDALAWLLKNGKVRAPNRICLSLVVLKFASSDNSLDVASVCHLAVVQLQLQLCDCPGCRHVTCRCMQTDEGQSTPLACRETTLQMVYHQTCVQIPFGVAHADERSAAQDTASSYNSAWRQRLADTLAGLQAQMAEGAEMLRDGAQAAVGCDAAAEGFVTGAYSTIPSGPP